QDGVVAAGLTEPGGRTVTGLSIDASAVSSEEVAAISGGDTAFDWLAWVQSWPEWSLIPVGANIPAHTEQSPSYVRHDKRLWQVKIGHAKQSGWSPLVAVSLFWPWYDPSEPVAWFQPQGSHDSFP